MQKSAVEIVDINNEPPEVEKVTQTQSEMAKQRESYQSEQIDVLQQKLEQDEESEESNTPYMPIVL